MEVELDDLIGKLESTLAAAKIRKYRHQKSDPAYREFGTPPLHFEFADKCIDLNKILERLL